MAAITVQQIYHVSMFLAHFNGIVRLDTRETVSIALVGNLTSLYMR